MPIEPTGSAENTRAFLTKTEMSNNRDITEKEHTMEQKPFTVRKLTEKDLCPNLLQNFDRYQQVERCWRKENGSWLLKDIAFTEQWSESEKQDIVTRIFTPVIYQGGAVLGIFRPDGSLAAYGGPASASGQPLPVFAAQGALRFPGMPTDGTGQNTF